MSRPAFVLRHSTRLVWCAAAVGVSCLCVWMQAEWRPTALSMMVSAMAVLAALTSLAVAIAAMIGMESAREWLGTALRAAGMTAVAPSLVRATMPWEEPGTGLGSPLAVLMGICMMFVLFGSLLGYPLFRMAWDADRERKA